jgi:hypothetical protein
MNSRTLLLMIFWLPLAARSQEVSSNSLDRMTPYDPKADYRTWSIKGKILPWPLGNGGGISGLLGVEYGFTKNQSIGIDGYAEYEENSDDMVQDTSGVTHAEGNEWHSWERAIFLNYRYYFSMQRLRRKGITPYIVAFVRYGQIDVAFSPLYPLTYYKRHELDRSAGILIGSTYGLGNRLGLDVNLGLFEKEKIIDTEFLTHGVTSETHWKPVELGLRLSVNLVYWFVFKKNRGK